MLHADTRNHRPFCQQIVHLAMPHTDTSKSQATNRTSYNASYRYQKITANFANKSYISPCLTQIPASHRQQIVHLAMPHTDTCKSQATSRASYHASHRYQKITGNKSYIPPCLTQIPANHRQQIVHLTMLHTDTRKSQAILPTNRTSCHASHRYQQITGNKSYILPCLTQIPANHRQQIVHLAMPHTDTCKSQATNRTSYNASYSYPSCQQIVHLAMPHANTSKSQSTSRASCHASHRYQQITGNKSYILPCLTQIPANHRQQVVNLAMRHTDTSKSQATNRTSYHASHRHQQITGNRSYILPCLTQIPANHRQQIVHLAMPHTDTCKSQEASRSSYHASHRYQQIIGNKSSILPCITQIPANHSQQIIHLAMPHTDTCKSQATSRASYQQIIANKSSILPCLTQIPANHRHQIVHLTMPLTDTSKSQATNRTSYQASHRYQQSQATNRKSCHASYRYQQITGNKSYILPCLTQTPANHRQQNRTSYHASHRYQQITLNKSYIVPCLTQIPANHRQQIVHLTMPHTDTSKSQATKRTSYNASYRYQKITGHLANKWYILPCLTLIPANHSQQVVLLALPHTDTSKSQATNRKSCHASHRYLQITGNKSCVLPANHRQQIVHLTKPHTDTSKSQATNRTS